MGRKVNIITTALINEFKKRKGDKNYENFNLKFNPFPPAGLPRFILSPFDNNHLDTIKTFILSTYASPKKQDYAGLTIIGEYGMGKTHLMKYIQEAINDLSNGVTEERKDIKFSAITCFVDKPEDAPQLVIHKIIEQIGLDNIRKYIGKILLDEFSQNKKEFHNRFKTHGSSLFSVNILSLFNEPSISNFLEFLGRYKRSFGDVAFLQEEARAIIKHKIVQDGTLADRYLDLVFEEKKASSSWDILAGYVSNRSIQKKEVMFLNSIVGILKHVGFHQLYVFVDEFEDVSKLKGSKLSNYLITLNTLINKQGKWAIVASLTKDALEKIKAESAPLYDRLTSYAIKLQPLSEANANRMVSNYLNLARNDESNDISPFTGEAIKEMLQASKGNCRSFILLAHKALDLAIRENKREIGKSTVINATKMRHNEEYDNYR